MKWCYKKFGARSYAFMIRNLFQENEKWLRGMTAKSLSSKRRLSVKTMRHLSAPDFFYMFKPSNKLKSTSMLIDSKPYIERALRLKASKSDVRAQCLISQNFNCALCRKPLLEFNDLSSISKMNQDIISSDTIEFRNLNINIGSSSIFRYQAVPWYHGVQIDHLIPRAIMKDFPKFKILEAKVNKVALHTHCHKIKTKLIFLNHEENLKNTQTTLIL